MSASRFFQLTKDATVPISLGLLGALIVGVFALAMRIAKWEQMLEEATTSRWTYQMEREAWQEYSINNPNAKVPNVSAIRMEHAN